MNTSLSVALLTVTALSAGAIGQVVNGGFELPGLGFQAVGPGQTLGSWTCAGPSGIEFVHATPNASLPGLEFSAYEGSYWIDLVGVGAPSGIYQDLITAPGTMYEVSFAMAGNVWGGAQIMNMSVLWNGGNAGAFSHSTAGRSGADMGWTLHTVTVTGTGHDRLMFQATSGASAAGPALDGVSIRVVPAPASMALLGAGALLVGRRKR
jgi:hypothetical protein